MMKLLLPTIFNFILAAVVNGQGQEYVPGDALWLGDYGDGEGTPDINEFFPISYTIFGNNGVAIPRLLLPMNESCPELLQVNDGFDGDVDSLPAVMFRAQGNYDLPFAFPIVVCEVQLEQTEHKMAWSQGLISFPGTNSSNNVPITTDPSKFLLIGDTGLRVKPKDLGLGECDDSSYSLYGINQCPVNFTQDDLNYDEIDGDFQALSGWPLKELMGHAAAENPDVVLYVGDYLYRQGPCPEANSQNEDCVGINGPAVFSAGDTNGTVMNFIPALWGDNLYGWWADFLYPALELLQTAPLIAAKGNHEICSRAGYGFRLLLSPEEYPEDTVAGSYCTDNDDPFVVPFEKEQILVMDNSAVDDAFDDFNFTEGACPVANGTVIVPKLTPDEESDDEIAMFTTQFAFLSEKSATHDTNFILNHRPLFAIACNFDTLQTLDWTMQMALEENSLDRVSGVLSGHIHWVQALSFIDQQLPAQLVVGHGGTKQDPSYIDESVYSDVELVFGKDDKFRGRVEKGMTKSVFGFGIMERNADGDYDVSFRSLEEGKLVTEDFDMTIPKGPRVGSDAPMPPSDAPMPPSGEAPPVEDLGHTISTVASLFFAVTTLVVVLMA